MIVAHVNQAGDRDVESGKKIRERILKGESYREAAHSKGSQDRRQADIENHLQHPDEAYGNYRQLHEFLSQAGDRLGARDVAAIDAHSVAREPPGRDRQRQDPKRFERNRQVMEVAARYLRILGGNVQPEYDGPENDGSAQRVDNQRVQMAVAGGRPFPDHAEENPTQDQPREDRRHKEYQGSDDGERIRREFAQGLHLR